MREEILTRFSRSPKKRAVVEFMLDHGIGIVNGSINAAGVHISRAALADAIGVDQRVVSSVVKTIEDDDLLSDYFSRIKPILDPSGLSPLMGWTWVEIHLHTSTRETMRLIASAFSEAEMGIKYILGDITSPSGWLHIITEKEKIPGYLIQKLRKIPGVEKVIIHS